MVILMRKQFTLREIEIFSELHSIGYSQKKIADLSGVSQATISRILQRKSEGKLSANNKGERNK